MIKEIILTQGVKGDISNLISLLTLEEIVFSGKDMHLQKNYHTLHIWIENSCPAHKRPKDLSPPQSFPLTLVPASLLLLTALFNCSAS